MTQKAAPGSTTPVSLEVDSNHWFQLQALLADLEVTSVGPYFRRPVNKGFSGLGKNLPVSAYDAKDLPGGLHQTPNLSKVGSLIPGLGSIWPQGSGFHLARKSQEG